MTKFISFIAISILTIPAFALAPSEQGRRTMASQMMAPRQVSAPQVQAAMASAKVSGPSAVSGNTEPTTTPGAVAATPSVPEKPVTSAGNTREKEKEACQRNNIGVGNTFVWASRYSNTDNYATMVEDIEEPDNNTCFVRVELKSNDAKVKVSDIAAKYFEWGRTITCGDWADEEVLKKRILDAKKTARTWGTVGGAVGGAALGVGAMELFGNKLIGGAVEGQHAFEKGSIELLRSQLAVAYKDGDPNFTEYYNKLVELQRLCKDEDQVFSNANQKVPDACSDIKYDELISYMDGLKKGNK